MILIGALKLNLVKDRLPGISPHLQPLSKKRRLCLISPKPSGSGSIVITSSTTFVIPDTFTLSAVLEGASGGSGGDSGGTGSDGGYTYISMSAATLVTANPGTGGTSTINGAVTGANGGGSWSPVYDNEVPTLVVGGSSSAPGVDNSSGSGGVGGKVIIPNLIKSAVSQRAILTITIGAGGAGGAGGQDGGAGKVTLSWT